jgi:hypothetical protein
MSTAYHGLETSPPEPYQWQEKDTSGSGRRKWLVRIFLPHSSSRLQPEPPTSFRRC